MGNNNTATSFSTHFLGKFILGGASALLGLALINSGCSSKEKAPDNGAAAAVDSNKSPEPEVKKDESFAPTGSDSGTIDGLNTIHFPFDKAILTGEAKKILASNASWIKGHSNVSIQIEGHCDSKGSTEYNLSLGERRAKAVREYLEGMGLPKKRLSIISYGKEKPLSMGDSEADMAKNRRANFVPINQ